MLDKIDKSVIKELQNDIPLTIDPYGDIAKKIGCSKHELLQRMENLSDKGIIKRLGIILHHRNSGYTENGMLAAVVPAKEVEKASEMLISIPNVTHCYERKCYPDWPYNLYTMIHGKNKNEVERIVINFVHKMNIENYQILYSTKEFKKTSMNYF